MSLVELIGVFAAIIVAQLAINREFSALRRRIERLERQARQLQLRFPVQDPRKQAAEVTSAALSAYKAAGDYIKRSGLDG